MNESSQIPPIIEQCNLHKKSFATQRLFVEIILAAIVGITVCVLPVLFLKERPPNYEGVVFLPIVGESSEMPDSLQHLSLGITLAVGLALGIFGRGPIWLIGPAVVFAFPIWSLIDGLAGGGGHDLWPFEMLAYGVWSLIYIIPTGIGRLTKRWWIKRKLVHSS